jgi:phosphate transport system substrate-binding protein
MKKAVALALVVTSAVALAIVAGRAEAVPAKPAKPAAGSLTGAGATFPVPLISKWIPAVDQALGIKITYASVGSGAGIAQITARTVDFGASDAPLTPDQLTACKSCVVIPWALAATSVMYNLKLEKRLRLTGPVLADIYLGKITQWDDPALKALNPGVTLPSLKITVAHRSDGSGTTYNFTEYLSSVSSEWRTKVGFSTAVNWPAGLGARGSSGVAGVVKSTDGAIGYADAAYAIQNKITMASMRNRAGQYTLGGLKNIQAALSTVPKKVTRLSQLKIVDPPRSAGKAAYPICTFTYAIVPTSSGDKAADLRKFIYWAVTQGQKFGPPLFFQPLPVSVQAFIYREIKKIQA